ncbi:hypothetical protein D3C81_2313740 [compost metagenome]
MPIINLTVGTISTWVYILVEGGIDKAKVGSIDEAKAGGMTHDTVDFTQDTSK